MDIQPITYHGRTVAACTPHRVFFSDELEARDPHDPLTRFVAHMCLYAGQILNGHLPGPPLRRPHVPPPRQNPHRPPPRPLPRRRRPPLRAPPADPRRTARTPRRAHPPRPRPRRESPRPPRRRTTHAVHPGREPQLR